MYLLGLMMRGALFSPQGGDLLTTVIDRWRSATMSHRSGDDEFSDYNSPIDAAPLQPAMPTMPTALKK